VTPAALITGFITECGIIPPTLEEISSFLQRAHPLLRQPAEVLTDPNRK
jgi:hypothetical protein